MTTITAWTEIWQKLCEMKKFYRNKKLLAGKETMKWKLFFYA